MALIVTMVTAALVALGAPATAMAGESVVISKAQETKVEYSAKELVIGLKAAYTAAYLGETIPSSTLLERKVFDGVVVTPKGAAMISAIAGSVASEARTVTGGSGDASNALRIEKVNVEQSGRPMTATDEPITSPNGPTPTAGSAPRVSA